MKEDYVKDVKIIDKTKDEKDMELIKNIFITKEYLKQAHENFEYAEAGLIEYYSYNIKANQSKLDYLIKLAKSNGIIMNKKLEQMIKEDTEVG